MSSPESWGASPSARNRAFPNNVLNARKRARGEARICRSTLVALTGRERMANPTPLHGGTETSGGSPRMMKSKTARFGAFLATLGVSAGLVGTAVHSTGAYFSDTKTGAITGTMGSIKVTTYGGAVDGSGNRNFAFANMLPGEQQTATIQYQNTGRNAEDVYIVFNDTAALAAINDLGHYGTASISN